MPGRQSIPSTGPRPHGSGRGRGGRGRGKVRGRSGRGRGTTNVDKSLQQQNAADCNQHQKQPCTTCHKNADRIKELQSKTTAGLLCLDEMTSVLDKLRIYLEDIQSDAALGLIENYENGAGGIHQSNINQETASNTTPQTLQDVINARPQYLTVTPSTYVSWLENELEITTLSDLSECINECINDVDNGTNNIDILAKDDINGHVWIKSGMRGAFRKYILRISAEAIGSSDEKRQLGKEVIDRSKSPKCFLDSPPSQNVPRDLQQEVVQISNRLDVDSAEEIVRDELPKVNDKSHTLGKKTKLKKLPEIGEGLPSTKEQRDDCNNNDEVRELEKKVEDTTLQGLEDSTATWERPVKLDKKNGVEKGPSEEHAKRSTSPRSSASAICNLVGSMDNRSKKERASAKAAKSNSKSPTPDLQQTARVVSPKTTVTTELTSPKGADIHLEHVIISPPSSPPSKARATCGDNHKGSEGTTKPKGKIVGSLPPPIIPPLPPRTTIITNGRGEHVTFPLPPGSLPPINTATPPKTDETIHPSPLPSNADTSATSVGSGWLDKIQTLKDQFREQMKKGTVPPRPPPPPEPERRWNIYDNGDDKQGDTAKSKSDPFDLPTQTKKKKPVKPTEPSPFGKKHFDRTNLSQFIKKGKMNKNSKNTIFGLLQSEDTRDEGRALLQLEGKAYQHNKTITNLLRMKEDVTKAYKKNRGKVSKFDKNMTEEEKKKRLEEEAIIDMANKLASKEYKKEQELKEEMIKKYDQQIADETKELEVVRFELRKVKGIEIGVGIAEDRNFHIDDNRDNRGHTYLMVASQNDDYITAEMCLSLGADPTMSIKNDEGLSAIHYSHFFGFDKITDLIVQAGGILPDQKKWSFLESVSSGITEEVNNDWDCTLKIAEAAAIPPETLFDHPEKCEADPDLKMNILSEHERQTIDFTCFESRLEQQDISSDQVRREVHIEQSVYKWLLGSNGTTRLNFINVMEGLKPPVIRRQGIRQAIPRRRATIGVSNTFDLFAIEIDDGTKDDMVVLCSPFVAGEADGVSSIGVLVWAVVRDDEASLYKTLISNTEFMRNKTKTDDRYLRHKERNLVLELGKDMYLLDLHSTSIWTTSTMVLYTLDVDKGDLDRIQNQGFMPKKRVVHSEEKINKAIFRASKEEAKQNEEILVSRQGYYKSTLVMGGAGTGKTLLIIKKLSKEDQGTRILVLSRLPRLIRTIKVAVEEERDDNGESMTFTTYDDLLKLLAQCVMPDDENDQRSFLSPKQIRFETPEEVSEEDRRMASFSIDFIGKQIVEKEKKKKKESTKSKRSAEKEKKKKAQFSLNDKDRKQMNQVYIEPLTLWQAIITIKSNARCANTKMPLTREEYVSSRAFDLSEEQRELCYDLFLKYERWRKHNDYWDETDRVMYVLKHGPCVFSEEKFVPWTHRVSHQDPQVSKDGILDDEGSPQYPFFFDIVCADESQDFTQLEIALFIRMCASLQSFFLAADPCQSVESGICMKEGTVNDVIWTQRTDSMYIYAEDPLQTIQLETNHRTHSSNLDIGQAIRRILARSFRYSFNEERALVRGKKPQMLKIDKLSDLADKSIFCGGNIVFLAPDEIVTNLKLQFTELGIENDILGVREAKGLEFDSVALIGFFSYIEDRCSGDEWRNALLWLSSTSSLAVTESTEVVSGVRLRDCDYTLHSPQVSDEVMMLYTALTRAKDRLYLIEGGLQSSALSWREKLATSKRFTPLVDEAFRRLNELSLAKPVTFINGGEVDMSPSQHKARGVLYVTQALTKPDDFVYMKDKFERAFRRFGPDKGNDSDLLRQAKRHFRCIELKRNLIQMASKHFFEQYENKYNLEGKFDKVLRFEQQLMDFATRFLGDNFFWEEVKEVRCLVEEVFVGTLYEFRFADFCIKCREIGC